MAPYIPTRSRPLDTCRARRCIQPVTDSQHGNTAPSQPKKQHLSHFKQSKPNTVSRPLGAHHLAGPLPRPGSLGQPSCLRRDGLLENETTIACRWSDSVPRHLVGPLNAVLGSIAESRSSSNNFLNGLFPCETGAPSVRPFPSLQKLPNSTSACEFPNMTKQQSAKARPLHRMAQGIARCRKQ